MPRGGCGNRFALRCIVTTRSYHRDRPRRFSASLHGICITHRASQALNDSKRLEEVVDALKRRLTAEEDARREADAARTEAAAERARADRLAAQMQQLQDELGRYSYQLPSWPHPLAARGSRRSLGCFVALRCRLRRFGRSSTNPRLAGSSVRAYCRSVDCVWRAQMPARPGCCKATPSAEGAQFCTHACTQQEERPGRSSWSLHAHHSFPCACTSRNMHEHSNETVPLEG
jgi:hypothetical protein